MNKSFLSNNEEIVLRLLYSGNLKSSEIPKVYFGEDEKETLVVLKLIMQNSQNEYVLTDSAIEVIEKGKFIIKYPLHNEQGVVMDFVGILNSYSKEGLAALGLSIINTESYTRWGKYNNLALYAALQNTMFYYNSFEHPVARIAIYQEEIQKAISNLEKVLALELAKIKPFTLPKPVSLNVNSTGETIYLVEYINELEGKIRVGTTETLISFNDPMYSLTNYHIEAIVKQYYSKNRFATK